MNGSAFLPELEGGRAARHEPVCPQDSANFGWPIIRVHSITDLAVCSHTYMHGCCRVPFVMRYLGAWGRRDPPQEGVKKNARS